MTVFARVTVLDRRNERTRLRDNAGFRVRQHRVQTVHRGNPCARTRCGGR